MKTQKLLTMIFVFVFFFVNTVAQESSATLQETLTWMKSKTDLIEGIGGLLSDRNSLMSSRAASRSKSVHYFYDESWQLDTSSQCTPTWRNTNASNIRAEADARKRKRAISSNDINTRPLLSVPLDISVPLTSLDPDKVEVLSIKKSGWEAGPRLPVIGSDSDGINVWAVMLSTTNEAQQITWNSLESRVGTSSLSLVFQDQQMAGRVAKAFRHGIELCGGKKSGTVKEPF